MELFEIEFSHILVNSQMDFFGFLQINTIALINSALTAPEVAFRIQFRVGLGNQRDPIISFMASCLYHEPSSFLPTQSLHSSVDEYFREKGEPLVRGQLKKNTNDSHSK
jgi:hypothetical protein